MCVWERRWVFTVFVQLFVHFAPVFVQTHIHEWLWFILPFWTHAYDHLLNGFWFFSDFQFTPRFGIYSIFLIHNEVFIFFNSRWVLRAQNRPCVHLLLPSQSKMKIIVVFNFLKIPRHILVYVLVCDSIHYAHTWTFGLLFIS